MRADFLLPVLLSLALVAMIIYAARSGGDQTTIATTPVACNADIAQATLRELPEASGLAASQQPQMFWTHNDSAEPVVFAIGAEGRVRGRVRVAGASVTDWEAVTTAPCDTGACLFVGDIGDNDHTRSMIIVYRTPEPSAEARTTDDAVAIEGVYPDGPQDAEAMFVSDGQLFVVTKGEGARARVYRFPSLEPSTRHTLQLVATLTSAAPEKTYRITDAAVSPDARWVALRTNDLVLFYVREALLQGVPGTPLSFDVRGLREPQGEGIAWADPTTLLLAGESEGAGTFASISCNLPG